MKDDLHQENADLHVMGAIIFLQRFSYNVERISPYYRKRHLFTFGMESITFIDKDQDLLLKVSEYPMFHVKHNDTYLFLKETR
jgi:hypothetical protein